MPPRDPKWKPAAPYAGAVIGAWTQKEIADRNVRAFDVDMESHAAMTFIRAAVRDALGLGRAPASMATHRDGVFSGTFMAGGKRFAVDLRLDYGEAPETALEGLREELAEAERLQSEAAEERDEYEREAERLRDRLAAWQDTVTCALEGDGEGAVEEAKMIPKSERP